MKRTFLVALILVTPACASYAIDLGVQAPATFAEEPGGYEVARVDRVVDGDTIAVEIVDRSEGPGAGDTQAGHLYDVRLIGIDTPESVKPGSPVECFGKEAAAATTALLNDAEVRMVKDVENTDAYDRLLRYVYIGDELANARLVVNGYANAYTYPPNIRHSDLFVALQRDARKAQRGLWSPNACDAG